MNFPSWRRCYLTRMNTILINRGAGVGEGMGQEAEFQLQHFSVTTGQPYTFLTSVFSLTKEK